MDIHCHIYRTSIGYPVLPGVFVPPIQPPQISELLEPAAKIGLVANDAPLLSEGVTLQDVLDISVDENNHGMLLSQSGPFFVFSNCWLTFIFQVFINRLQFPLDIVEVETEDIPPIEDQGPVPLPELSGLLEDAKSKGRLTDNYVDFVKHHGDHLKKFYPKPTKTTLNLYGKLIVETYSEFKNRFSVRKKMFYYG